MSPTLKLFLTGIAVLLSLSTSGYAQYGGLPYAQQDFSYAQQDFISQPSVVESYGFENQVYDQPEQFGSYQPSIEDDAVNQLYMRNAQGPLKGLFAPGFTRTLTVLGGWNFLNSIEGTGDPQSAASLFVDLSDSSLEAETGYAISFAFGRRHNHQLRSEIELAVRENDIFLELGPQLAAALTPTDAQREGEVRAYSIMKNFIVDLRVGKRITPYVGAGLGWSYLDLEVPAIAVDGGVGAFSYQFIGGVATTLNKATDFIVEYRFFGTSEVQVDSSLDPLAFNANNLFLGLKFEY